jgi:hypothetical protein
MSAWSVVRQLILALAMLVYILRAPPEALGVIAGAVAIAIGELQMVARCHVYGHGTCQAGDSSNDSCL